MMEKKSASRAVASIEGMVRVRVYLRTEKGNKVPMLGYLSPESLVAIQERFRAKSRSGGRRCHVTASVKELNTVEVSAEACGATLQARKLLLGLTVQEGPQRQQSLRDELGELMHEAERIRAASLKPSALNDQPLASESTKSGFRASIPEGYPT